MKYQIYHGTQDKGHSKQFTAAVEIPTKENLRIDVYKLLGENPKAIVSYNIGFANLNPKDRYVRKMGKQLACERMEQQQLKLVEIIVCEDRKSIVLSNERVMIVLEMKENRDKVHLIEVQIA
jgi:hypothetical protein